MTTDTIPQIDEAVDYAAFLDDLRDAFNIKDDTQWLIGDQLNARKTVYAEHTIENIADDIGCAATSLYDYRGMAEFYPVETRAHYKSKGLYYSHLRVARRLKTLDEACRFLDECDLNKWSVFGAEQELRARKGIDTAAPLPRLTPDIIALAHAYMEARNRDPYESRDDTNEAGHAALWALIQLVAPGYEAAGWKL